MLIDCSYFTDGPRHIQNATLGKMQNVAAQETLAAINAYIRAFQRPFLKGVLGDTIAESIISYLANLEKDDNAVRTEALDKVIHHLREPFANYVFYKILRDSNSQATITGLVRLKCANDYVAPIRRQVSTWNNMVEMLADFTVWSRSSECPVPGITTDDNFLTKINVLNL